jgi:hypothetical protein
MDNNLKKVFQKAIYNPENQLSDNIWRLIVSKENKKDKIRTWSYSITGVLSVSLLFPVISKMVDGFGSSGFFEYISLIFSDSSIILTYWKEFVLLIINSVPFMSFGLSLILVFVLFVSIKKVLGQFRSKLSLI